MTSSTSAIEGIPVRINSFHHMHTTQPEQIGLAVIGQDLNPQEPSQLFLLDSTANSHTLVWMGAIAKHNKENHCILMQDGRNIFYQRCVTAIDNYVNILHSLEPSRCSAVLHALDEADRISGHQPYNQSSYQAGIPLSFHARDLQRGKGRARNWLAERIGTPLEGNGTAPDPSKLVIVEV